MDKLIFLDTETTGNNLLSDRLFQVCFKSEGKVRSEYFKPPIPISIKAQSITHVTNQMVEDRGEFAASQMKQDLQELLKEKILVAHSAAFDICMLSKEGVEVSRYICTLRVARFLDSDCQIPEYNMQYLRYHYQLDVNGRSHEAEEDVLVLEALFRKLYGQMMEQYGDHDMVIAKMVEVSSVPTLFKVINFGKYKGMKLDDILKSDRDYMEWLLNEKSQNAGPEDDWVFTLKHYLNVK